MLKRLRNKLPRSLKHSKIWEKTPKASQQRLEFDQEVVFDQNQKRKIPTLRQFRYLPSFFSAREQLFLGISIFAVVAAAILIIFFFYAAFVEPLPAQGGSYREALVGRPVYVNPILANTNDVDLDLVKLIYSGLLSYNKNLEIGPDLAESFEINEDETVYTLKLREGATWHDGVPVTIDDVMFTYRSIQDPLVNSPLQLSLQDVAITRIDDRTVEFQLTEAFTPFITLLTVGILPQHLWSNVPLGNFRLAERNIKPIGSGPWKFDKLEKDRQGNLHSYTLIPHEEFYGNMPYLEQLSFRFFPDDLTGAITALNNNKVDGISFVPRQSIQEISNAQTYQTHHLELPQYTALFLNPEENEILKAKAVRQAIAYSIDRTRLIEEALDGLGLIISGPLLPGMPGYDADFEGFPYNPIEAQAILEEAGWEPLTADEYIEKETARILKERADEAEAAAVALAEEDDEESTDEETSADTTEETVEVVDDEPIFVSTNEQVLFREKDGEFLKIKLSTVQQPESLRTTEIVRDALRAIGFIVDLEVLSVQELQDVILPTHKYEALLFGHILNVYPDLYPFWHSSQIDYPGLNLANFSNKEVDKLLDEARKTIDQDKRGELYKELQDIIDVQQPATFLYSPIYTYLLPQKIKGFDIQRISISADRWNNLSEWYIKTKKKIKFKE